MIELSIIKGRLLLFSLMMTLCLFSCSEEKHAPPNILFISIDDLKPTLGCYGDPHVISPNIDALASKGTLFLNNHCQQAVCGPSRASLLTGMYPDQNRIWGFYSIRQHNPDVVTLPQYFKNHGYTTVNISKIFDYRTVDKGMDTISWSWPYFPANDKDMLPFYSKETGPVAAYFYQSKKVKSVFEEKQQIARETGENPNQLTHNIIKPATECLDVPDNAYKDGVFAEKAILDMKKLAEEGNPFFLAVGFERPHLPWTAPKKYWDMYNRDSIQLEPFREHAEHDKAYYYGLSNELRSYTDESGEDAYGKLKDGIPLTEDEQKLLIHGYRAAVSYIDMQVGKMLQKLEEYGLAENTIVVLWGDHGWHLGDHGIWGKATNFEQATRSPLIISVPGIASNITNQPTEFTDLFPTLCELANLDRPEVISGQSLLKLIKGEDDPENLYAFSQFNRGDKMGYAIRDERYRYVEWMEEGRHVNFQADYNRVADRQLFDYEEDPLETENVFGYPQYAEIESKLEDAMHSWLKATRAVEN
jgi:iduronate 2-sulfatase